jgi:hypothetical protein
MSQAPALRLYSRQGCCLCEGLEERLRALVPPPPLAVVDVDLDPALQARYGLRVPVLALPPGLTEPGSSAGPAPAWRDLPPVPPRLAGERLQAWLAGFGVEPARGVAAGGATGGAVA